jgi:uncharacterized membrane protein YdjX (TVP38/TMEM64 family)
MPVKKVVMFLLLIVVTIFLYWCWGDKLSLDYLIKQEAFLKEAQAESPLAVYLGAFFIYVVITGLSFPGAGILSLIYGWYFGLLPAIILLSFASTTGATVAFLLSRYYFHDFIQNKFSDYLKGFNEALKKEGAFYLFMLRLIPAVPFFVINIVMGLTPITAKTFWWVSQIGMLPGTIVYVYAGSTVPSLEKLKEQGAGGILNIQTLIAFTVLGLFPLIIKKVLNQKIADSNVQETD